MELSENTKKMIELLEKYIDEYKKLERNYEDAITKEAYYKELIDYLENNSPEESKIFVYLLLSEIYGYGNDIYQNEFDNIIRKPEYQEELQQFISRMKKEYFELKEENSKLSDRKDRNKSKFFAAKRVKKSLSKHIKISTKHNDDYIVKQIINYYEAAGIITNKEAILFINEIELHNRRVEAKHISKKERNYTERLYNELPNIISFGFQEHDVIKVSEERKKTLDNFSKEIQTTIESIEKQQISKLIDSYLKYNLESNEINYIIINILNTYIDELITIYHLILDKDVYTVTKDRVELVKDYYRCLEKYIEVINYYNRINTYKQEETKEENESPEAKEDLDSPETRRLIYSRSESTVSKAKIIDDMLDIAPEYYEEIYELIIKFKNGTLGNKNIKTIQKGNKSNGHIELKGDGVRIVLKRVKGNIYNVFGVFIKKANNDMKTYEKLTNRVIPNVANDKQLEIQLGLSEITEKKLEDLVKTKARPNGR